MSIKYRIQNYIRDWEAKCYFNGLPDEVPSEISDMVPSYKRIAFAILKNDYPLTSLGFSQPKSKVYSELKRIEIAARPKHGWIQLSLFTNINYLNL